MRLAAVYFTEHYLFEKPQVINIVGNFFYDFKIGDKKITINRKKNTKYVENLHSSKITELSAIVGANVSGKTTLYKTKRIKNCISILNGLDFNKINLIQATND